MRLTRSFALAACALICAPLSSAAEPPPPPATLTPQQSSEAVERMLNAPEFGTTVTEQRYRLRWDAERAKQPTAMIDSELAARSIRIVMIVLGLAALLTIVISLARNRVRRAANAKILSPALPTTVLGLDVRPDSLPDDVAAEVRRLWESGEVVAALSVLYRATLADLIHRRGMHFSASATERECVELASDRLPATAAEYFRQLTRAWQRAAYGRRLPEGRDLPVFVEGYVREIVGER